VVDLLATKASQKGLLLSYQALGNVPDAVLGDVTRFKQIIINLVNNALKFTEQGQVQILTEASKLDEKNYEIRVFVKDTGIGIPEDVRSKLFRSFSQVDASTTRKFGGTGLGLAISQGLCERMGGTISVESIVGIGSVFKFSIVCETTEESLVQKSGSILNSAHSELGKKHPLKVLVVEDNRTNQMVAMGLMSKLGYDVDLANNGIEALQVVIDQNYDIIFMDCHMPELDGFEATRQIKRILKDRAPRIVALTASIMKEDLEQCKESGMEDFVSKPIQVLELIRVLGETKSLSPPKKSIHVEDQIEFSLINPVKSTETHDLKIVASFNEKKYVEYFDGMPDLALETIETFFASVPNMMQKIEKAIHTQAADELEISAHTLKGSLSYLFAENARLLAWRLEKMGQGNTMTEAKHVLQELQSEIDALKAQLKIFKQKARAA
jgi:CheY-like chemotaxis protein